MANRRTLLPGAKISRPSGGHAIRRSRSPAEARGRGRHPSHTPRADWDSVKVEVMRCAVAAKFMQNPALLEQLRATGDEELVHESPTDRFWGRAQDGIGSNHLGAILMRVRADAARLAVPSAAAVVGK